jgi:hypothetical protein
MQKWVLKSTEKEQGLELYQWTGSDHLRVDEFKA